MLTRRLLVAATFSAGLANCGRPEAPLPAAPHPLDTDLLSAEFPRLAARARPGEFALGVASLNDDDSGEGKAWASNANRRFPLQSVFKAPLAAAALAQVDAGQMKLGEKITLTEA